MNTLMEVYRRLYEAFGPQHWWPGESPFEVIVGTVLTQNTNWRNVEKAIENLRQADCLTPDALYRMPLPELEELIRPAGYYKVKARRLRNLLKLIIQQYDGSLETMFRTPAERLREQLLETPGIGPETADSILLYAGEKPFFVVDTYTYRVFARHGWIPFEADYHQIQEYFHDRLPQDVRLFNEYHALLVKLGKEYCRKGEPRCEDCPLKDFLPAGGPLQPD